MIRKRGNSGKWSIYKERLIRSRIRKEITDPANRLKVYRSMLETIEFKQSIANTCGFCRSFPEEYDAFDMAKRISLFPELRVHRPPISKRFTFSWWFQPFDYDTRISILNTIIEEMSSKTTSNHDNR